MKKMYKYYEKKKNIPKACNTYQLCNVLKKNNKKKTYLLTIWVNAFVLDYIKYNKFDKKTDKITKVNRIFLKLLNTPNVYEVFYLFKSIDDIMWYCYDTIMEWNINKPMYNCKVNYEFNAKELMEYFDGNTEKINHYKKSLSKGKRNQRSINKENEIISLVNSNEDLTLSELYKRLENVANRKTIKKVIDNNGLNVKKIRPEYLKIIRALDDFFLRSNGENELTNQFIMDRLCINESSLKRFKRKFPEYNEKIIKYNELFNRV